ncbi:TPA: hypothetical protein MH549_25630 [Klebsiella pneumoniae]|nr:hypothetical protein [Klebsiella pneumoniae]
MPEHAPPGPVRRPGLLGWIALLPGVLIGFCLGAWMLAITLEWLAWLAVPVFLESRYIVIPGVMLSGLAGSVATGAFKKHL